ncbi:MULTISPECIES: hypothetical protein [Legionella]|uniref:Uncharacterized protein n=1 Tax=Legionella resiliens TaxID=2905958 RepID=A0ABS8X1S4_9GAMM|nr:MULTISPECIES: hypothetical protein [unclassified Legionella]MCE0722561.1 hypothetical protein [Legionella sp. 9fVS26]MCE3531714.1 hypothetical protein [Legionella sp. 8cVS16]
MQIDRWIQYILRPYLILIFILTALGSWQAFLTHSRWHMGDWLINYQGGFIRRGLLGEVLYQLSVYSSVSLGFYVFICLIFFNALFLLFSFLLLKRQPFLSPYILLIFSPFIFAFPINSVDHFESIGGYFKDCIYYCVLAFIGWSAVRYQEKTFEKIYYFTLLCYPLLILTHEVFAVFLPYLVVVYLTKVKLDRKRVLLNLSLLSLSIISFVLCIVFKGNDIQVTAIYNSLLTRYPVPINGSIGWLGAPMKIAMERVLIQIQSNSYFKIYGFILLFSSIAFLPVMQQLKFIFKNKISLFLCLVALIGTLALCCIAIDWGRFIRFNLVSLFILSLVGGALMPRKNEEIQSSHRFHSYRIYSLFYIGIFLFTLSYAFLWRIPSCCNYRPPISDFATNNLIWAYQTYKKIIYEIVSSF